MLFHLFSEHAYCKSLTDFRNYHLEYCKNIYVCNKFPIICYTINHHPQLTVVSNKNIKLIIKIFVCITYKYIFKKFNIKYC